MYSNLLTYGRLFIVMDWIRFCPMEVPGGRSVDRSVEGPPTISDSELSSPESIFIHEEMVEWMGYYVLSSSHCVDICWFDENSL